jgi:predicted  nucleic acid-binding Zn-ribbon protein
MEDRPSVCGSLPDGASFYAPLGEMLYDGHDRVCCHVCGRWMKAVGGTHLRWHGWTIDEYREAFQLGQQTPTCAPGLSARLARAAKRQVGRNGFGTPPPRPAATRTPPPGWRSMAHVRPELVSELHPTATGGIDPHEVAAGSHPKLWWRCGRCGHEWEASVSNRVAPDSGCPRCAIERRARVRRHVARERSSAATHPGLAKELHPARNQDVDPYTLGAASTRNLWWRCSDCGHEWQATVANRSRGTGCPACWRRRRSRSE